MSLEVPGQQLESTEILASPGTTLAPEVVNSSIPVNRLDTPSISPAPPDTASLTASATDKLVVAGEALLLALVIFVTLRWVYNGYRKSTGQSAI